MAMTRNNESYYWYGFEGIGTVRQLMGSQGQVVDAYAFDAWGNEITNPQSQVQNPFKYVGKYGYYLDAQSSLMLLGVRYYNAEVGRFVSLDPIKDGKNWYRYVGNNPIQWIDPTGLKKWQCKNPKPPKLACKLPIAREILNFHWCRGCEFSCSKFCTDNFFNNPGNEWDRCMKACQDARVRCQVGGKFDFEARW
jgi:RHS repeat-associated protein